MGAGASGWRYWGRFGLTWWVVCSGGLWEFSVGSVLAEEESDSVISATCGARETDWAPPPRPWALSWLGPAMQLVPVILGTARELLVSPSFV